MSGAASFGGDLIASAVFEAFQKQGLDFEIGTGGPLPSLGCRMEGVSTGQQFRSCSSSDRQAPEIDRSR